MNTDINLDIGNGFVQSVISRIIRKAVAKKLGMNSNECNFLVTFKSPISVRTIDGNDVKKSFKLNLDMSLTIGEDELGKLIKGI